MKLAIDWEVGTVTTVKNTHDVVLKRMDGSVRNFRIYGRPTPNGGDTITLPVDGRLIRARVSGKSRVSLPNQEWSYQSTTMPTPLRLKSWCEPRSAAEADRLIAVRTGVALGWRDRIRLS